MSIEDFLGEVRKAIDKKKSHFDKAILTTLKHEGGFVNDPVDPGGATNWGMSIRYLKGRGDVDGDGWLDGDIDRDGDIDIDDIKQMTVDEAIDLYRSGFWDKYDYDQIKDYTVAARVFDMTVNMGARQTGKIVQRALNKTGHNLVVDGLVGRNTFKAINATDAEMLMAEIRLEHANFYLKLIEQKPELAKYKRGWLRRAAS